MTDPDKPSTLRRALLGRQSGYIAFIVLSLPVIYLFGYRHMSFFMVPSASMEPTLMIGDHLVTLASNHYERGDVVVTKDPQEEGGFIVKRIIGLQDDVVEIQGGAVRINGNYVSEPYIKNPPDYRMGEFRVPEGRVFLLGDNRNNSDDAHVWSEKGQPEQNIIGKVCFIYYPYERAGGFDHSEPLMTAGAE